MSEDSIRPLLFQSTLPTRGETIITQSPYHCKTISIHSPHTGRDAKCPGEYPTISISIHSPHTGRDVNVCALSPADAFQSTLPTRGETVIVTGGNQGRAISIHSPHTGRDGQDHYTTFFPGYFNPLSPHGERHRRAILDNVRQSISIHSPHTGRDFCRPARAAIQSISIHSPHTGRDSDAARIQAPRRYFNPLSPHGERLIPSAYKSNKA